MVSKLFYNIIYTVSKTEPLLFEVSLYNVGQSVSLTSYEDREDFWKCSRLLAQTGPHFAIRKHDLFDKIKQLATKLTLP